MVEDHRAGGDRAESFLGEREAAGEGNVVDGALRIRDDLEEAEAVRSGHVTIQPFSVVAGSRAIQAVARASSGCTRKVLGVLVERLGLSPRRLEQHLVAEDLDARSEQPPHDLEELRVASYLAEDRVEAHDERDAAHGVVRCLRAGPIRDGVALPAHRDAFAGAARVGDDLIGGRRSSPGRRMLSSPASVNRLSTTR